MVFFPPDVNIYESQSRRIFPRYRVGWKKKKDIFFPLWNTCVDLRLMENGPLVTAFSSLGTLSWTLLGELKEGEHDVMKAIVLSLEKILTNVFFGFLKYSHSFRWRPWLGWGVPHALNREQKPTAGTLKLTDGDHVRRGADSAEGTNMGGQTPRDQHKWGAAIP